MEYILQPAGEYSGDLFNRITGIGALPFGATGFLKMDFRYDGAGFNKEWYVTQPKLQTTAFDYEFSAIIEALRHDGQNPPLASRKNLAAFCAAAPGVVFTSDGAKYKIQTADY